MTRTPADIQKTPADIEDLLEIETIKGIMARYARLGETGDWESFRELFTEDFTYRADAGPRASADASPVIAVEGRDTFVDAMESLLDGVVAAHQIGLPEVTLTSPTTARSVWAIHDYIKTPKVGTFKGWGHITQQYVKIDGEWKIRSSHTTRTLVEEDWLS
ncbi:nuclear transport factor 2 family protein [Streptomyces phaeochromogenes]|uniref:nuclear transport factor 2 family protein n=1 Tax=Streptomyces phaeochromogenes TaxID=1923 RepID=UPI002E2C585B|nr:nuclear transport factor 2 family protein [Streptomyces phaeochromogenes]